MSRYGFLVEFTITEKHADFREHPVSEKEAKAIVRAMHAKPGRTVRIASVKKLRENPDTGDWYEVIV